VAQNEAFEMRGPAGRLEAILIHPETPPVAAAVVCHAHPLQGGMMHFKVVFRAAKALQASGLGALRFNFRGVGLSEGAHDLGIGEQDDVSTALDELERRFPDLPLVLGGFSFGSVMALRVAARDPRPAAVFALGFPIASIPESSFVSAVTKPRLFVQAENDSFGGREAITSFVDRLPEPRQLRVIKGSDHFFTGHLEELQGTIETWAAARPWQRA
jgi:alpha/beta superfamily hydrolase